MKHWPLPALALPRWSWSERLIAAAATGTLLAGLVSSTTLGGAQPATASLARACDSAACSSQGGLAGQLPSAPTAAPPVTGARGQSGAGAVRPATPRATTSRVTPTPRPSHPELGRPLAVRRVPAGVDAATAVAIGGMRLSPTGYRSFLRRIDRSYLDDAQRFVEFDPDRVRIRQGPSQVFIWHFTAFYRNAAGPSRTPVGDMAIHPFIRELAQRGDDDRPADHVCCGVNWVIDRHGPAHQLAPVNAKLRHNPPYDSINTGVEIEAARQVDITTAQYETTAYLTIAVLDAQRLLGRKPLSEIVKGHGEMRDAYLEAHPHSHLGQRNDFDEPESRLLRQVIETFLRTHPEVARMSPRLR